MNTLLSAMPELSALPNSPIVAFTILLLVILTVPPFFERLKLPGLVGLLIAGVVLGPDGLNLISHESEAMKLLSDIGKLYLMFVAGLEVDLKDFRKTKNRSLGFGLSTFLVPFIFGFTVGYFFNMGINASVLIGSLLASHTLLGYPIIQRFGVVTNEAVTVTIGATIFTDTAALLVLAICVSIHQGSFSTASLVIQLGALAIYAVLVLFGFDWAGREYFRRTGNDEGNQFLFILLAVFLASVGAQMINIEKIVGAFLAGLAVNDVLGRGPVGEKVVFVGSTLFIPFFFVDMGLLLSVPSFITTITSEFWLTLAIVTALISSKFLAAIIPKFLYGYNWYEAMTMWSLSLPQVAATLAATLVGVQAGVLTTSVFNAVIVMMVVTSIMGPMITDRFARRLSIPIRQPNSDRQTWEMGSLAGESSAQTPATNTPFTVIVPVHNPNTERYLIESAALIARHEQGVVVPLAIIRPQAHLDDPEMMIALQQGRRLLQNALAVGQEFEIQARAMLRIDDDIAHGISRTAREQDASLIVMGWGRNTGLRARLFGNILDSVFWSSHCPVAVMRWLDEPINICSILVPVKNITPQALRSVQFAQLFAKTNQARMTLLHVYDRQTDQATIASFEADLNKIVSQLAADIQVTTQVVVADQIAQGILNVARNYDLVVLRSVRRRTAGGLAVSDVTTEVLAELQCSIVLFGEAYYLE